MVTESGHVVPRVHRKQICVTSLNEFQESLLRMAPWQEPKAIDSLVTGKCGVSGLQVKLLETHQSLTEVAMTVIGCNANKSVISNANKPSRYAAMSISL